MAHGTADQVAANWSQGLSGATERIRQGVASVTVAPGQAAARQKDVWAANVAAAKDRWATNVQRVTLGDWQTSMTDKGIGRISAGATAAQPKVAAFLNQFLPHVDRVKASLPPRGGLEQNLNRMVANARGMAQFKRTG